MAELNRRDRFVAQLTELVKQVVAAGGRAELIVIHPLDAALIELETIEGVQIKRDEKILPGMAYVVGEDWAAPGPPKADC